MTCPPAACGTRALAALDCSGESDGLSRRALRFFFFSREEERLHIHVQSANGEAKYWLDPGIELASTASGCCWMAVSCSCRLRSPWCKRAPIEAIPRLQRPMAGHLHWPELDIDLSVDSIEHPERYPLKATP